MWKHFSNGQWKHLTIDCSLSTLIVYPNHPSWAMSTTSRLSNGLGFSFRAQYIRNKSTTPLKMYPTITTIFQLILSRWVGPATNLYMYVKDFQCKSFLSFVYLPRYVKLWNDDIFVQDVQVLFLSLEFLKKMDLYGYVQYIQDRCESSDNETITYCFWKFRGSWL